MFVVVAGTIVAFWRDRTTCSVVPVTTWLGVGETKVRTAGEDGREPAGVGAARSDGDGALVAVPEPPQAATARITNARVRGSLMACLKA
jgi:hypothetical protein